MGARWRGESAQAAVEWIGLVLLVSLLALGLATALGPRVPGESLARAIAERMICAVQLSGSCEAESELETAYGAEIAALAREHAPRIRYERGMTALPVDFRSCREDACSRGAESGQVWRSTTGEPVVAFVHVVDCRPVALARTRRAGADCSGPRRDNLYLQYWFYYAGSATAEGVVLDEAIRDVSAVLGTPTHHRDDWESYQVRLRPGAAESRSSSHQDYVYDIDGLRWPKHGWGRETRTVYVSGGSHAGNSRALRDVSRITPRDRLRLIPLEPIAARGPRAKFADPVKPPWLKRVWSDPEYEGTD